MLKIRRFYAFLIFVGVGSLPLFFVFSRKDDHKPPDDQLTLKITDVRELKTKQLQIQNNRKQKVADVCKTLYKNQTLLGNDDQRILLLRLRLSPIFVDDRYKFLYCSVSKVGCTNWKRTLLMLTGKMNTSDPAKLSSYDVHVRLHAKYLKKLEKYSDDEILYRLKNYYKFMFVREPFERLLSAYRDKFDPTSYLDKQFIRKYGPKIVHEYRTAPISPSKRSSQYGYDVQLEEFLRYLVDPKTRATQFNRHWELHHKLCHPCLVQYDFIGKYETFDEDVDLVMSQLGIQDLVKYPDSETKGEKTSNIVAREFENISAAIIGQLAEIYSTDLALFGYGYPSFKNDEQKKII